MLLGSDTAASAGVDKKVQFYGWLQLIASILVGLAGIVTPLGLYDDLSPGNGQNAVQFHYMPDTSTFGRATNVRAGYSTLRVCSGNKACPGAPENLSSIADETEMLSLWPGSVSLFTSGVFAQTVSSLFDIEWRSFRNSTAITINVTGSPFSKGYYRHVAQLILDDGLRAVEGLLVDTHQGRIGFRNHTVPIGTKSGAMWTEELLFVEPVTRCVDTNISFEYTFKGGDYSDNLYSQQVLVDRGGFANLEHTKPNVRSDDFQADPALYNRAYSGAWRHNMLLMQYLNITTNESDGTAPFSYMKSHVGSRFNASGFQTNYFTSGSLVSNKQYGIMLDLPLWNGFSDSKMKSSSAPYPFNITLEDAHRLGTLLHAFPYNTVLIPTGQEACSSPSLDHSANMSAVGVSCGIVFGVADRTDGGDPMVQETDSTWRTPVNSCAAATIATVREVIFHFNGSANPGGLVVSSINDKTYPDVTDMPLWGMELLKNYTIANATPLWGIVSPTVGARKDISIVQRQHLWLPGIISTYQAFDMEMSVSTAGSNLAGNTFYLSALDSLFAISPTDVDAFSSRYSGRLDAALYAKWLNLSQTATDAELMLNLIWADVVANSVVGTRGWVSPSNSNIVEVPVHLVSRVVKYHLLFLIPAGIALGLTAILIILSVAFLLCRRSTIRIMRDYLSRTSSGRIMGFYMYPERCGILGSLKTWTREIGKEVVLLPGKDEQHDDESSKPGVRRYQSRRFTV
jgi:hypothetical protein